MKKVSESIRRWILSEEERNTLIGVDDKLDLDLGTLNNVIISKILREKFENDNHLLVRRWRTRSRWRVISRLS